MGHSNKTLQWDAHRNREKEMSLCFDIKSEKGYNIVENVQRSCRKRTAKQKGRNIMPRVSEELTNARREEIIQACASLYETMGFKDITIRDIGAKTSFTRTSIYNYFQTKEEIFLALLEQEHRLWVADLKEIAHSNRPLSADGFADALAHTLEKRGCMLKLMCMNLYDMECNSRMENLVSFKKEYANALAAIRCCLETFFPDMTADHIQEFLYAFFPFLFGIYPYTSHTEKQIEAMCLAHVDYKSCSVYELTKPFLLKMLAPFERS